MKSALIKALSVATSVGWIVGSALGQTGWSDGWCHPQPPPDPPPPAYSLDFGANVIGNELMIACLGGAGTVTWGGTNGPCFSPAQTMNARGRIAFMSGSRGSIQSTFDDRLAYVTGAMFDVSGSMSYACTTKDGTGNGWGNRTLYGSSGWVFTYIGESDRYVLGETIQDGIRVHLRMDVVADAARLQWDLTNEGTAEARLGLWFGSWTGMVGQETDATGNFFSGAQNIVGGKPGYVITHNGEKPPRTDQTFVRTDPVRFPPVVDFMFGQTTAYGLRVENEPTSATKDFNGQSDASVAYAFDLGSWFFLLGPPGDNTFPDITADDLYFLDEPAFIQKFPESPTAPGAVHTIVHWFRSTWSESSYAKPYAVALDAPKLLSVDPNGANGLTPNPFTIRVYIDNVRSFSKVNEEVPLQDTKVRLILPTGINLEPGETALKNIGTVPPKEMRFVDYQCRADGNVFGAIKYRVQVDAQSVPNNGNQPEKDFTGTIQISSTPKLRIRQGANLVTTPWIFSDSSWEVVLQLQQPQDFQAFDWLPQQNGYVVSTSAQRGKGSWIVATQDFGYRQLGGNPQVPNDIADGAPLIQVQQGWNLIGNPYPYAFPLGQIVGISGSNNQNALTWAELVSQGIVQGFLAYWDPDTQSYQFIQGTQTLIQPNTGYWLFVNTTQDLTISWPAIYEPFLPGSSRDEWKQTDSQWRLKLSANSSSSIDSWNYIGQAKDANSAKLLRANDPPMGPTQMVNVAIVDQVNGKPTKLAQLLQDSKGRKEWTVSVEAKEAGQVTLTWPNMASVPRNTRFRIVDKTNNQSRDMRRTSGYTFTMGQPGTREFTITAEPGNVGTTVINNVVVSGGGRAAGGNNPFTITYTLSGAATTTVRVLSGAGKEVYVAARGRADKQGPNQVTWTTRDSAGRSVAPGAYRLEIIAETEDGQRVRKIIPINVVR